MLDCLRLQVVSIVDAILRLNIVDLAQLAKLYSRRTGITEEMLFGGGE